MTYSKPSEKILAAQWTTIIAATITISTTNDRAKQRQYMNICLSIQNILKIKTTTTTTKSLSSQIVNLNYVTQPICIFRK